MVRVLLVGCGFMGRMHANVYRLLGQAELVAVVDRHPARREAFAAEFGIPAAETLEDGLARFPCDAVDICLPTHLHADATVTAAGAGKHVLCEKPMALNLADADRMIEATRHAGVKLMIGHCIRFWPEYAFLKDLVDTQLLGKLLSLNLTRYGEFPHWSSDNWLADPSLSGGGVLDMHIHDTDFALYLLGQPQEVVSFGTVDARGASFAFTTMQYPGAVVHLEGGWNLPPKTPFKMTFRAVFERGAAIMEGGPLTIYAPNEEPRQPEFPTMRAEGGGNLSDLGGYFVEIEHFAKCVADDVPIEIASGESARASLAMTLQEIEMIKGRLSC